MQVNTYVAHPWVFQDAVTHESLNANSKSIFEPGPWYEVSQNEFLCLVTHFPVMMFNVNQNSSTSQNLEVDNFSFR